VTGADERRRAELEAALEALRARIAGVCATAERDPAEVTLVAVTKTWPASDVAALARIGVRDVGENRDQEAVPKVAETRELLRVDPQLAPRWHFVGQVQSRKCTSIASYADCVHSLDRTVIATKLANAVAAAGRGVLDVFVQLRLDDDPDRGGVHAAEVEPLADAVAARTELRLRGLMAVAPLGTDPDAAFADLAAASARLRERYPHADAISAGMSADLDAALRHGATHVRVGSALLGRRAPDIG
jgi:pyridoxal phosphate enzyme (YggS family)